LGSSRFARSVEISSVLRAAAKMVATLPTIAHVAARRRGEFGQGRAGVAASVPAGFDWGFGVPRRA
jgi:hypothetical protein